MTQIGATPPLIPIDKDDNSDDEHAPTLAKVLSTRRSFYHIALTYSLHQGKFDKVLEDYVQHIKERFPIGQCSVHLQKQCFFH